MFNCINSKRKRGVCTKKLIKPMFLISQVKKWAESDTVWVGRRPLWSSKWAVAGGPTQAWQQASVPAFVLSAHGWASADVRAWASEH